MLITAEDPNIRCCASVQDAEGYASQNKCITYARICMSHIEMPLFSAKVGENGRGGGEASGIPKAIQRKPTQDWDKTLSLQFIWIYMY